MTERKDMEAVLEAVLFVANEPVSREKILQVFDQKEAVEAGEALDAVCERYRAAADGGIILDEAAGGLRLVTRPDLHGYLRRFFEVSGSGKLSMAALEALAIVAYRQPVTAPEIQELRSVSSSGVLKTLLERRLVRISGRKEVVGKPFLYATTRDFLMHFGLSSLQDLPPLEQFEELFGGEDGLEEGLAGSDHEEEVLKEAAELEEAAEEAQVEADAIAEEAAVAEVELLQLAAEQDSGEVDSGEAEPESEDPESEELESAESESVGPEEQASSAATSEEPAVQGEVEQATTDAVDTSATETVESLADIEAEEEQLSSPEGALP